MAVAGGSPAQQDCRDSSKNPLSSLISRLILFMHFCPNGGCSQDTPRVPLLVVSLFFGACLTHLESEASLNPSPGRSLHAFLDGLRWLGTRSSGFTFCRGCGCCFWFFHVLGLSQRWALALPSGCPVHWGASATSPAVGGEMVSPSLTELVGAPRGYTGQAGDQVPGHADTHGRKLVMERIGGGSHSVQMGNEPRESIRCEAQNPDTGEGIDGAGCPLVLRRDLGVAVAGLRSWKLGQKPPRGPDEV